jgi:hypothetical protein
MILNPSITFEGDKTSGRSVLSQARKFYQAVAEEGERTGIAHMTRTQQLANGAVFTVVSAKLAGGAHRAGALTIYYPPNEPVEPNEPPPDYLHCTIDDKLWFDSLDYKTSNKPFFSGAAWWYGKNFNNCISWTTAYLGSSLTNCKLYRNGGWGYIPNTGGSAVIWGCAFVKNIIVAVVNSFDLKPRHGQRFGKIVDIHLDRNIGF